MKFKLPILLMLVLCVGVVNAVTLNTFNNSLNNEDLEFNSTFNITRYLDVPENILITDGFMNLTGKVFNYTNHTPEDYLCVGSSFGTPCTTGFDGNWATFTYGNIGAGLHFILLNYTVPSNVTSANYTIKVGSSQNGYYQIQYYDYNSNSWKHLFNDTVFNFKDLVLPPESYSSSPLQINFSLGVSVSLPPTQLVSFYDARANWYINPHEPYVEIGGIQSWDYSGRFNVTERTNNLQSSINTYLETCSYVNGTCSVPFLFHSDTKGVIEYSDLSFTNIGFIENNQTFNSSTFETSEENFIFNITFDNNTFQFVNAFLIYNGTRVSSSKLIDGNDRIFTAEFDIPLINATQSELKNFYWEVALSNTTDTYYFNTTPEIQNVSKIFFTTCNASLTTVSANFKAYDEANLTQISPFIFQGTFDIWLGDGSIKRTYSIDNSTVVEMNLCISPTDRDISVDGTITYDGTTPGTYVARDYNFDGATFNGTQQNFPLHLLQSGDSTTFILKVQDNTLQPVSQALILIQRYYPGTNEFKTVQIAKTGDDGKSVGFYKTETVDYRHIIQVDGETQLTTTKQKIVGEDTPFTLTFTIGVDLTSPLASFEDVALLDATLEYVNATGLVTFTYEDTSGNFTGARLYVYKVNPSGNEIVICNTTSTTNPSSITCDVSGQEGTFVAHGFIERSPEVLRKAISFVISGIIDVFGTFGLFLAWFIILTAAMTAIWNPSVGIILINASVILTTIIGLASFSPIFIFSLMGVSILLLILIKT